MPQPTLELSDGPPLQPRSAGYLADPYAALAAVRAVAPVSRDPGSGLCFLLGHEGVATGLADITRNPDGGGRRMHFPSNPFAADGPGHARPRKLIMPRFVNRAVQRYRDRAQEIVDEALPPKGASGELEVVEQLGFPLPYRLTCEMLGVPAAGDVTELREWTRRSLELIDAFLTPQELAANLEASAQLAGHLAEVLAWKRDHLADDVVSAVIAAADEGEVMRPDQVASYVHTLYLAGMHTTVNQTALSLNALMRQREQWELLVREPELLDNAVEELLRFEPTAQYMRRTGTEDHVIDGVRIPAGTEVVCWIASANRDPARWGPTADELDLRRADAQQHIAFGKGPHVCVGSWLARLELGVVVGTVARRFPGTQLAAEPQGWTSNVIRGPEALVLDLRP